MNVDVRVVLTPALIDRAAVAGQVAVVSDVLRATSTMTAALGAGAAGVVPFTELDEARAASRGYEAGSFVMGGERGGLPVEGFELGNSPSEYTRERVGGRTVLFSTTNGTKTINLVAGASQVLCAALLNVSAAVRLALWLSGEQGCERTFVVCSGIHDEICTEDVICAGAIARAMTRKGVPIVDDAAQLAMAMWDAVDPGRTGSSGALMEALRASRGGRNLRRIGLEGVIPSCAAVDSVDVVPVRTAAGVMVGRRVATL